MMFDSGFTSDMRSNWVLVQPSFVERMGLTVDKSRRHRVVLADGTATNTIGMVEMDISFPGRPPRRVSARVLEMTDSDRMDLLIGFTFMLHLPATLYHCGHQIIMDSLLLAREVAPVSESSHAA